MQKVIYRIEYVTGKGNRWYLIHRDFDEDELDQAKIRLENLREQSRDLFRYRLIKRIYLDEVIDG